MDSTPYALGVSSAAQRRLEIQDAQFEQVSEELLDRLQLRSDDRVVELGIGPGGLGQRILKRLGPKGTLIGVDYTQGLLRLAQQRLAGIAARRFQPVLADVQELGSWIDGADVVVGRTVLHHLPMAEAWLGRLLAKLKPGTRIGFVEPEFRILLTRITRNETRRSADFETLRLWAEAIVRYYTMSKLSPGVGATMALALESAGCQRVESWWREMPIDQTLIENMLLFGEEVRDKYASLGIMSAEQIDKLQRRISDLPADGLPAVWGTHGVTCVV